MLNIGLRMLGSREDAEDAVQMAFLKLYRGISGYRFEAKFSTFLYRIMVNCCLDALQKRKRSSHRQAELASVAFDPKIDLKMQLEEAIAALPDRMRACFVLFAIHELKQQDIASILELSVGAVKSHIFQAKAKLRALLSEQPTTTIGDRSQT